MNIAKANDETCMVNDPYRNAQGQIVRPLTLGRIRPLGRPSEWTSVEAWKQREGNR